MPVRHHGRYGSRWKTLMWGRNFWQEKTVFITGHTGFKGAWLSIWLSLLGAKVTGYALQPPTEPSLYELCNVGQKIISIYGDVRDREFLEKSVLANKPEIIIHMAAQPLVRESYKFPVDTYDVNVMGTINLLEAVRQCKSVRAVVNVTTDKCYDNREWLWGYRENESLGGFDPYSSSKACSELVTAAYRSSYFPSRDYENHRVAIATARAGNVIGGGDWAIDRLIPDCVRAILKGENIMIRNPQAIRPWQHVLDPLKGYLLLAQKLYESESDFAEAWNFGPDDNDAKSVEWVVNKMCELWGTGSYVLDDRLQVHEAHYLKLDCSKARLRLGWEPRWNITMALEKTYEWCIAHHSGLSLYDVCRQQIEEYNVCAEKV